MQNRLWICNVYVTLSWSCHHGCRFSLPSLSSATACRIPWSKALASSDRSKVRPNLFSSVFQWWNFGFAFVYWISFFRTQSSTTCKTNKTNMCLKTVSLTNHDWQDAIRICNEFAQELVYLWTYIYDINDIWDNHFYASQNDHWKVWVVAGCDINHLNWPSGTVSIPGAADIVIDSCFLWLSHTTDKLSL